MNIFDSYYNTKLELNSLKNRLNLILKYQEQYKKEEKQLKEIIKFQENLLLQIETDLSEMTGIQNKLYYEIVINGISISQAIDKIAKEENKDISTLWKNYYPKVKERLIKLNLLSTDKEKISN